MRRSELKKFYIPSPLNYIGGKGRILNQILPAFPPKIDTFVDLFCGGCNVGINVRAKRHVYNDLSPQLIGLLKYMSNHDAEEIITNVNKIIKEFGLSETALQGYPYYGCCSSEGVAAYNKEKFLRVREEFNGMSEGNERYYLMLYVLVIFGFNNQMRFNSEGKYNLPVGKRDFNFEMQNKLRKFISTISKQDKAFICNDFRNFKFDELSGESFVYVDPPYLISTATYNENGGWTEKDERDLLSFLAQLDEMDIKFALSNVLEHKDKKNTLLKDWIEEKGFLINELVMNYRNSNYQSKKRDARTQEVLITNYNTLERYEGIFSITL